MREIKFKAWDKEKKKMIYNVHTACDVSPELTNGESWFGAFLENETLSENYKYVVMQYTGLKDKNGKAIFEGDILKTQWQHDGVTNYDYEIIGKIIWWRGFVCWAIESKDRIRPICSLEREQLADAEDGGIEIIGNIYENPELLKEVIEND